MDGTITWYPASGGSITVRISNVGMNGTAADPAEWELVSALLEALARRASVAAELAATS